ncbi:MAG: phenylalanine--tRNA ligase subunit beta, partial [Chitinophagales bacterium]
GLDSGVGDQTKNIFLESAWFNPLMIRKTSLLHGLRTDAAIHFEKGMDISNTVNALKRAATLIKTMARGKIASNIVDIYPSPKPRKQVLTEFSYLKKISGKEYKADAVKNILSGLDFEFAKEEKESITVSVPYHKPDIALPADIAEEIMRIDGYDQIEIPASIRISPSIETNPQLAAYKEKIASWLVGTGFSEIFTNSITNSTYYSEKELESAISMINNLSSELNIMRPSLLETGLESVSYNLNRKNTDLRFFEFGKSYQQHGIGKYEEKNHLSLYVTGNINIDSWKAKSVPADFFYLKGICNAIFQLLGVGTLGYRFIDDRKLGKTLIAERNEMTILSAGRVDQALLRRFDIRQPVYFADINWDGLEESLSHQKLEFSELAKQLPVFRDLALVVDQSVPYEQVRDAIEGLKLEKLEGIQLFDIFESEKLGPGRKSMAINLTFVDEQKTMTDKEIDMMMSGIIKQLEDRMNAEIRR